jgi:hypothetical protein
VVFGIILVEKRVEGVYHMYLNQGLENETERKKRKIFRNETKRKATGNETKRNDII